MKKFKINMMHANTNDSEPMGKRIVELASNTKYKTYVEAGTYKGNGSTLCFIEPITDRKDDSKLYTIECNAGNFQDASRNLAPYINGYGKDKLELIYGSIVKYEELPDWPIWHNNKKEDYKYNKDLHTAPCVFDMLPTKIDVLLLDSGGWSRQSEWEKLRDRVEVILIDDTKISTNYIREEILSSPGWKVIDDNLNHRNGWLCAERLRA